MATLQCRNGSWRALFWHNGQRHSLWVGEVAEYEATAVAAKVDYWLMRLKQKLVDLPAGCDIVTFIKHDGRPPSAAAASPALTHAGLWETYLRSQENKLEANTLGAIRLHVAHLQRILGRKRNIPGMTRADLQGYVDKRGAEWIDPDIHRRRRAAKRAARPPKKFLRVPPVVEKERPKRHPSGATIKKEIISLRTAWNWARRHLGLKEEFPGSGLDYAKTEEALPFMTWEEAERRVAAGDDPDKVWDCVYLRPAEVAELLDWIKGRPVSPWVHPMLCFAAFTGARRSEIIRALPSDVDLVNDVVTIREKKRDQSRYTTRRVPIVPTLKAVLATWSKTRADGKTFFCKRDGKAITPVEAQNYFRRGLRVSKWSKLRGWHALRHSFVSALANAGVDQRVVQDMCGHMSAEMTRRYSHFYPDSKQDALRRVFG